MRKTLMAMTAGAALVAGVAQADSIGQQQTTGSYGGVFGDNGFVGLSYSDNGSSGTASAAGPFALINNTAPTDYTDAAGNFVAFCLDIVNTLSLATDYFETVTPFSSTDTGQISTDRLANVQNLFNTAYSSLDITDNTQAAGFQLALWEVVFEGNVIDPTAASLDVGDVSSDFFVGGSGTADAIAAANAFLTGMSGAWTNNYELTFLQSTEANRSQGLVTMAPIPLPAGGLLLLGALGGLAVARRRRKA